MLFLREYVEIVMPSKEEDSINADTLNRTWMELKDSSESQILKNNSFSILLRYEASL